MEYVHAFIRDDLTMGSILVFTNPHHADYSPALAAARRRPRQPARGSGALLRPLARQATGLTLDPVCANVGTYDYT